MPVSCAVITPAGPLRGERLAPGFEALRALGLEPVADPRHADARRADAEERPFDYLALSDDERARQFADACASGAPVIAAGRGGMGCTRILAAVAAAAERVKGPRTLLGFSDITALHCLLAGRFGWKTIHGPNVNSLPDASPAARAMLKALLARTVPFDLDYGPLTPERPARADSVTGVWFGGNLSLVASLCGTPWLHVPDGAVLFLEDVNEPPYRIDRMLTQLADAGVFDRCVAVLVGSFRDKTLLDVQVEAFVARTVAARFGGPVLRGARIGHIHDNRPVPVGCRVRLDGTRFTLLEAGDADTAPAVA